MSYNLLYAGTSGASGTVTAANLAARGYDTVGKNGVVYGSQAQSTISLAVSTTGAANNSVQIQPGDWWVNGYLGQSTTGVSLQHAANSSGSNRIDAVVAQVDLVGNAASLVIVQGPAGGGYPSISTSGSTLQILLAFVTIPNGATLTSIIAAANVSDQRGNLKIGYNGGFASPLPHAFNHGPSGTLGMNGGDPLPSLAWPEGFAFGPCVLPFNTNSISIGDLGWQLFGPGATLTVQTGYSLYITGFISAATGGSIQVQNTFGTAAFQTVFSSAYTNQIVVDLPQPLIVGAGGIVKNPSGTVNSYVKGVYIPSSGKINPITYTLPVNTSNAFSIAAGNWFVLTHLYTASSASAAVTFAQNGWAFAPPYSAPDMRFFSSSGTPAYGSSIVDANGVFPLAIRSPMLFSPNMNFGNLIVSGNPIYISGYTFPQTG